MKIKATVLLILLLVSLTYFLTPPVRASSLFTDDFSSNDLSQWDGYYLDSLSGTVSWATSDIEVHSASYSATFSGTDAYYASGFDSLYYKSISPTNPIYARCYVYLTSLTFLQNDADFLPTMGFDSATLQAEVVMAGVGRSGGSMYWAVYYRSGGIWTFAYSASAVSSTGWYCVELEHVASSGANLDGEEHLLVNDTEVITVTGVSNNDRNIANAIIGGYVQVATATSWQIYIDDANFSDTYIGPMTLPMYSNVSIDTTTAWLNANLSCYWTTTGTLSGYFFSENFTTGQWRNDTFVSLSGSADWANVTRQLNATGMIGGFRWYCNDTANTWGVTDIRIVKMTNPSASVTQTTDSFGVGISSQRHNFYAAERFWIFFTPALLNTELEYCSSADGYTWTSPVGADVFPDSNWECAVWYDAAFNKIHLSSAKMSPNSIWYRCGTPQNNGTITWITTSQDIWDPPSWVWATPFGLSTDTDGYPYIWIRYLDTGSGLAQAWIDRSEWNNGTWSNATGYPMALETDWQWNWIGSVYPLTNGKMVAVYNNGGVFNASYTADGNSWSTPIQWAPSPSLHSAYDFCAVTYQDSLHLIYGAGTSLYYTNWTSSGWLGSHITIADNVNGTCLSVDLSNNLLYCFYLLDNTVYFKRYNLTSYNWDPHPTILCHDDVGIEQLSCVESSFRDYSRRLSVMWVSGFSPTFTVDHAFIDLNPGSAGSTTDDWGSGVASERHTFYAANRFWVFYSSTANDLVYVSSTDGYTWSAPTLTGSTCSASWEACVWYDANFDKVHYVTSGYLTSVFYRMGTPQPNGVITWADDVQNVWAPSGGTWATTFGLSTDTDGYPYIWIRYLDTGSGLAQAWIDRSEWNNGTWSNATGYPMALETDWQWNWIGSVYPLTDGKMVAVYTDGYSGFNASYYDGNVWSVPFKFNPGGDWDTYDFCAVTYQNTLHFVWTNDDDATLYYTNWTSSGWFGSGISVEGGMAPVNGQAPSLCVAATSKLLYCFWASSSSVAPYNNLYYKRFNLTSFAWDTDAVPICREDDGITILAGIESSFADYYGRVQITWMSNPLPYSPYTVKMYSFDVWDLVITPPSSMYPDIYDSINVTAANRPIINATIAVTGGIQFLWDNTGFSELTDPSNYAILDVTGCTNTSSTTVTLIFKVKFAWNYSQGNVDVTVSVVDDANNTIITTSMFYFETDLAIQTGNTSPPGVYSDPFSPVSGSSFYIVPTIYFQGTSIPSPNTGQVTFYAFRSSIAGQTTTIDAYGQARIPVPASAEGTYAWLIYAVTPVGPSVQNQTISIYIHATGAPPSGPVGPTMPQLGQVTFYGSLISLGGVARGQQISIPITITWTGTNQIIVTNMSFIGPNWQLSLPSLPQTFYKDPGAVNGTVSLTVVMTVPESVSINSQQQLTVIVNAESGSPPTETQVNCIAQFTVVLAAAQTSPTYQVQLLVGVMLAVSLGAVLFVGTRKRKNPV